MQNNKNKTIGILSGLGSAAGADFFSKLIQFAQTEYGAKNDSDFPPAILYNLPVRDFEATGFENMESVKSQVISSLQLLENAGADFLCIACNTVHCLYEEFSNAVNTPILSIVDATLSEVMSKGYKKVGLFSSRDTKAFQVYTAKFRKHGLDYIETSESDQDLLDHVISEVMEGKIMEEDSKRLLDLAQKQAAEGADAIVLGCTELPLAFPKDSGLRIISTTEVLAKACLAKSFAKV